MIDLLLEESKNTKEPPSVCVVRLTTSQWNDKNGIYEKKSIRYLQRKCTGWNCIEEDISMIGADEVMPRIINLYECKDGIYEVIMCNEKKDWETGCIDDYDYKLIPYE